MLNNSLHTCLCSKVQYQWGKVIFFRDTQVSKRSIFFSDKCKDRAALQSWPLPSSHLFHQFKKLLVWMTAQWLLFSLCCKQFVFTQMCISLTHSSQLVSSTKQPIESFWCYKRWWCIQYMVSPLISHFAPSPASLLLLFVNTTLRRGLQFLCHLSPVTVENVGWRCRHPSTSTVHHTRLPHCMNSEPA